MINALKNLFREKVVSNSIEAAEVLAYDMDIEWEREREEILSKIKAHAKLDILRGIASIGDTFDYLGVHCMVVGFNVDSYSWAGIVNHSACVSYQYRDENMRVQGFKFSSDSIELFEALMSKSKS